jgi:hypothetical protein
MRKSIPSIALGASLFISAMSAVAGHAKTYEVTITNLTSGVQFTPVLIASHKNLNAPFFKLGDAPSDALAALAEGGDSGPLQTELEQSTKVRDTANTGGLLEAGQSVTVEVNANPRDHLSLTAMMLPTNDGFIAAQNVSLPRGYRTKKVLIPAYDAGSEPNDELCISIPGPVCGGEAGSPGVSGEGFVHIHPGIHGIGDLVPASYDWNNPVAKIEIKRVH